MSFLRANAKQFLEQAKFAMQKRFYNLVLFNIEQEIQLYLKFILYLITGEYPKTHKLSDLFKYVVSVLDERCNIKHFYENNKDFLNVIEFSYISSRYLPHSFSEENAQKALKLGEEFDVLIEECLKIIQNY